MSQRAEVEAIAEDVDHHAAKVPAQFRGQYLKFIREGDASDEFLEFLDRDPATQEAVEAAFAEQVQKFERFAEELNIPPDVITRHVKGRRDASGDVVLEMYSTLTSSVPRWLSLPPKQQSELARKIAASVDLAAFLEALNGLKKTLVLLVTPPQKTDQKR